MKFQKLLMFSVLLLLLMGLAGCSSDEPEEDRILIVTDRFFAQQMGSIQFDPESFFGRTLRYSGEIISMYWEPTGETLFHVGRPGDDCCGAGGIIGFTVYLNDIPPPADTAWVEVTGVFEEYYLRGFGYISRVNAISVVERERP